MELNAPQTNTSKATLIETSTEAAKAKQEAAKSGEALKPALKKDADDAAELGESKKKKKRKNKKAKGIEDFMDDAKEAEAFKQQEEPIPVAAKEEQKQQIKEKRRKTVNFNLDNNEVKVFDKTKKIAEMEEVATPAAATKKSIA
jgi:hypothetical protein